MERIGQAKLKLAANSFENRKYWEWENYKVHAGPRPVRVFTSMMKHLGGGVYINVQDGGVYREVYDELV